MKRILICTIVMFMTTMVFSLTNELDLMKKIKVTDFQNAQLNIDKYQIESESNKKIISTTTKRDENGYRVVEFIWQQWTGSEWTNYRRYTYSYNVDDLLSERVFEIWDDLQWTILGSLQYSYNDDGNITEILDEAYIDGEWINFSLFSYSYDNNGLIIERLYQYWINSEWENNHRFIFIYDDENCIEESYEYWENEQWNNSNKTSYTYDENNNVIELIDEVWENYEWVNYIRDSFTYNNDNLLQEKIREMWDNDIWNLYSKIIYSYDEYSNLIEKLGQGWNNGWIDDNINSFLYDENQNQIEWLYQSYYSGELINMFRYTNDFDENNNEIISIYEDWENDQWVYDTKYLYTYEQYAELTEYILSKIPIVNYPNPFNPTTTISFSILEESQVDISICNIKGQKIKTLTNEKYSNGKHSIVWNGDDEYGETVSSGIYFYKLEVNGHTEGLKKMLLLK